LAGIDAKVIDGDDIRVTERGDRAGFPLEAAPAVGTGGAVFADDFDRDIAVEAGITGAIDLAHAADPEHGPDLVGAKSRVRGQRHAQQSISCGLSGSVS
jgi:hypothetical protein